MENVKHYIDYISRIIEIVGILTIFSGLIYSLFIFFKTIINKKLDPYRILRQTLGKSILLGLEILISADIIATVSTEPTLRSVTILGLIVMIRTFLSLSLQVELEGKLPWQAGKKIKKYKSDRSII